MPIYNVQKTSQKGQVLFYSTDMRMSVCPILSLQMPEKRAQQIVDALAIVEKLAAMSNSVIELIEITNVGDTMKLLRNDCQKVINAPIEK